MKIVAYDANGRSMIGVVDEQENVQEVAEVAEFWQNPEAHLSAVGKQNVGPLSELSLRSAVPASAKVAIIGTNYRKHALEMNLPIPTIPLAVSRWGRTMAGSGEPVPAIGEEFDWECELGVVIGRRMFRVNEEEAAAGVFGYAAFNDLSARDLQMQTPQWSVGKNTEKSGPMGTIVTKDEVRDPADGLRLTTRVNGKTVQDSSTADMIFTVGQLVSFLSQGTILEPGDFIATGTPSGVGMALGWFLKPGDVVEVEVETLGIVRTPIVAPPAPIK